MRTRECQPRPNGGLCSGCEPDAYRRGAPASRWVRRQRWTCVLSLKLPGDSLESSRRGPQIGAPTADARFDTVERNAELRGDVFQREADARVHQHVGDPRLQLTHRVVRLPSDHRAFGISHLHALEDFSFIAVVIKIAGTF